MTSAEGERRLAARSLRRIRAKGLCLQFGEERFLEYGSQLLKLYRALAKKGLSFPFSVEPRHTSNTLGYLVSLPKDPEIIDAVH